MSNELTYNVEIKSEEVTSPIDNRFIGYKVNLFINNTKVDHTWAYSTRDIKRMHKHLTKVAKREVKRLRALAATSTFTL